MKQRAQGKEMRKNIRDRYETILGAGDSIIRGKGGNEFITKCLIFDRFLFTFYSAMNANIYATVSVFPHSSS